MERMFRLVYLSIYNVTQIDYDKPEVGPGQ